VGIACNTTVVLNRGEQGVPFACSTTTSLHFSSLSMSQGAALRQKADKKAATSSGWSLFGSSSSKNEEAHDLYTSAANAFKMEKLWKDSGDCFVKAAEINDDKDDAANDFWNASKSYKKTHPERTYPSLHSCA
jgi:alpha-soluble NSF attachment protein